MPFQDHIHLDTVIGDAPENAPTLIWAATKRSPSYQVFATFKRGITGKLQMQVASDSGGDPLQFNDMEYTIKCASQTTVETLVAMLGKQVYLVDHYHANDGEDHTDDIRTMMFAQVGSIEPPADHIDVFYLVSILLIDADTVS